MTTKVCFKCLMQKPIDDFYKHSAMKDGHLNKCKSCTKDGANKHRQENLERMRSYDRMRGSMPHRVAARTEYQKTQAFAQIHRAAAARWASSHPQRRNAQVMVGNALRSGVLTKQPCFCCGEKAEAHHPDYDRPLDVVWLCTTHHNEVHAMAKEA